MPDALISLRNVTKTFGGLKAVADCSFDVRRGSITGLIGPNGAGKSTVFNMIAGLLRPSSGRILFEGQDITRLSPEQRFHRGIVRTFQMPHVFHRMTVIENLMLVPPHQSGESLPAAWMRWGRVRAQERDVRRRAEEVLETLNLAQVRDELAGRISGGQKKLLELGRTMMTESKVVLLDEPGAGVNPALMEDIAGIIQRLNAEQGYTFCIIEHDMDLIARLCDPVVVMAEGTVLTEGPIDEVRRNETVLEAYLGTIGAAEQPAEGRP